MRAPGLIAVLAVLMLSLTGASVRAQAPEAGVTPLDHLPALRGDYFRIESGATGRPYHIYVRYPEGYDPAADVTYPTVYLTDGDSLFPILARGIRMRTLSGPLSVASPDISTDILPGFPSDLSFPLSSRICSRSSLPRVSPS